MQRVTADGALAARNASERGEVLGRQDPPAFKMKIAFWARCSYNLIKQGN